MREVEEVFLRWALGFNGVIILALIGVIWRMLGTRLDRIERGLLKEISRLDVEVKDLRVRKHDNIEAIQNLSGRLHTVEEDIDSHLKKIQNVQSKAHLIEQLIRHRNSPDS